MSRQTVAEIDLCAVVENLRALRALLDRRVEIIAVVKADAYGHGAVEVSRALEAEGVRRFAVALVEEGARLREAGIAGDILLLGAPAAYEAREIVERGFEVCLSDLALACRLDEEARRRGKQVAVHLKFDVGMGRLGFRPEDGLEVAAQVAAMPGLRMAGVMTHFPCADEPPRLAETRAQIAIFRALQDQFLAAGIRVPLWHCANSGAVLLHPDSHFDAVRPGIALYGGFPRRDLPPGVKLRQPMTLKTRIAQVRDVPAGATISYGMTFRTARPSRIAVLPIGYADGYSRGHSNRSFVLVRGKRAPVVGRVCMDMTMVDVTDVTGVAPDDEVVLCGRQGSEEINVCELAETLGTISYEIMTGLGARVPRTYRR